MMTCLYTPLHSCEFANTNTVLNQWKQYLRLPNIVDLTHSDTNVHRGYIRQLRLQPCVPSQLLILQPH